MKDQACGRLEHVLVAGILGVGRGVAGIPVVPRRTIPPVRFGSMIILGVPVMTCETRSGTVRYNWNA